MSKVQEVKIKTLEKLKSISRKGFAFKLFSIEDGNLCFRYLANDFFSKLKREYAEIVEDPKDRTLCVLKKNIEVALEQKKMVAIKIHKLKNLLDNDHSIEAIKEKIRGQQENEDITSDFDLIPDECDNTIFRVQMPIESNYFFNRFHTIKTTKSN